MFLGDRPMVEYYTKNGEQLHTMEVPDNLIKDLSFKQWDYWEAKAFMYKHPEYKAFIFQHSGTGIPTSKEVLITDQSVITILK